MLTLPHFNIMFVLHSSLNHLQVLIITSLYFPWSDGTWYCGIWFLASSCIFCYLYFICSQENLAKFIRFCILHQYIWILCFLPWSYDSQNLPHRLWKWYLSLYRDVQCMGICGSHPWFGFISSPKSLVPKKMSYSLDDNWSVKGTTILAGIFLILSV
jgi:hypothetical protein